MIRVLGYVCALMVGYSFAAQLGFLPVLFGWGWTLGLGITGFAALSIDSELDYRRELDRCQRLSEDLREYLKEIDDNKDVRIARDKARGD